MTFFTTRSYFKEFFQATRCFLQIYKIQSNFLDIGDQIFFIVLLEINLLLSDL